MSIVFIRIIHDFILWRYKSGPKSARYIWNKYSCSSRRSMNIISPQNTFLFCFYRSSEREKQHNYI
jgi:hypothetical protein